MPAVIHVDRQAAGYTDRARAYKVLVDGDERGSLKAGEGSNYIRLERSDPAAPRSVE